jgi:ribonucleoside-diphosphate reductase alpha chain
MKKNNVKSVSLENLTFPSYAEVREKINKKVGVRPEIPSDLPKGIWTEQSLKVLEERYLRRDEDGVIFETPEDLCWRVAWEIATAESLWEKSKSKVLEQAKSFYDLLISKKFLPNSPTLMNAGAGNFLQYSGCFVLPVADSLIGIFDAIKYQAIIHQTGGGTGFSFTNLRPKGSMVKSSRGTASGPVSFMRIFDAATNEIKQGGKRRGANMGIIRVDHPDVIEFIHCKESGGITNFNISLAITNEFMKAYESGGDYDLIDPKNGDVVGSLSAKKVFDEISDAAWRTGDPGLIFIDRINAGAANPVPSLGPIEATNPCGEQPLYPYDTCNLGSIFLNYFVDNEGGTPKIKWEELGETVRLAVRFLDNVIEVNPFPLPEIRQTALAIRRIGLGVGGWADMLTILGIPYDSDEALALAEKIMKFISKEAGEMSEELAKVRGSFPLFSQSIYKGGAPKRNSAITTIAPTGSISIIAGASSGIEPLFAIAYRHIVKDQNLDRTLTFFNPIFESQLKTRGVWSDELKDKVAEHGAVREIEELPEDLRKVFGTAHEIDYEWHIKTQAAFQKYTDNAVSKTINLKSTATIEDIKYAYLQAWKTNCKGITVFRDGCKNMQVLNMGLRSKEETEEIKNNVPTEDRPFRVHGATYKLRTPVGTAFVTINQDQNGEPLELFINVGKAGSDVTAMAEALGRSISTAIRFHGTLRPVDRAKEIAFQLSGIGGRRSVGYGPNKILSLPDAIAAALSIHFGFKINGFSKMSAAQNMTNANGNEQNGEYKNGHTKQEDMVQVLEKIQINESQEFSFKELLVDDAGGADICPSCGASAFVYEEGCSKCHSCGHSEC